MAYFFSPPTTQLNAPPAVAGDLIVGRSDGDFDRLAAGASGTILEVVGGVVTWLNPANVWRWQWVGDYLPNDTAVTGSGSVAVVAGFTAVAFTTGITNPSSAGARTRLTPGAFQALKKVRLIRIHYLPNANTNIRTFAFLTNENVTVSPSLTAEHLGVKQVNGVVSFSTADGVTEETTDISAFMSFTTDDIIVILFDGTTATCYVNGTLRATHATNVPIAAGNVTPVVRWYVDNNNTANSQTMYGVSFEVEFALP